MTELEKIGKKMPYTLPEGSLAAMQQRVLASRPARRPIWTRWWGWALAGVAALALAFSLRLSLSTPDPYSDLVAAFEALDSADQEFLLDCYEIENF